MARNPSTSIVGELLVHILSNKLYLYIFENILSITTKTKKRHVLAISSKHMSILCHHYRYKSLLDYRDIVQNTMLSMRLFD